MDMVPFPVHVGEVRTKVKTNSREDRPHGIIMVLPERRFAVFRDKDQMDMHIKDTMSPMTYFI